MTYYCEEYERNNARLQTAKGRAMQSKRQSTVEPVFGTLTQFMGMRKINTIGIRQANKIMHMAAMAYNLKKYLKFKRKTIESGVGTSLSQFIIKTRNLVLKTFILRHSKITIPMPS